MTRKKTRRKAAPKEPLPEQVCPVCKKRFVPKSKHAVYDSNKCRVAATRQRQRQAAALEALNGDLDRLRVGLPATAKLVEKVTIEHGLDVGRVALQVSLAAAKEYKDRYSMPAKNGVSAGEK